MTTTQTTARPRASILAFYVNDDGIYPVRSRAGALAHTARDLRAQLASFRRGEGFVRAIVTGAPEIVDAAQIEASDVRIVDGETFSRAKASRGA